MKVKFFVVSNIFPKKCVEEMERKINEFITSDGFMLLDIKFDIVSQGSEYVCIATLLYSEHGVKEFKKGLSDGDLEALEWFDKKSKNGEETIRTAPHNGKVQ